MILDQLLERLRAHEREGGYHLERAEVTSRADAYDWLLDCQDASSGAVWLGHSGDAERRRAVRHFLWLRWRFRREQIERGGGR